MSGKKREIAEIKRMLEEASKSLAESVGTWKRKTKAGAVLIEGSTHEMNVALHLAPALKKRRFHFLAETGLNAEQRQVMDLAALSGKLLIGLESKTLWGTPQAKGMSNDLARLRRSLPKLARRTGVATCYAVLTALCRKQTIVDWWVQGGTESRPKHLRGSAQVWSELGREMRKHADYGQFEIRKATEDGSTIALRLLYAIFPTRS